MQLLEVLAPLVSFAIPWPACNGLGVSCRRGIFQPGGLGPDERLPQVLLELRAVKLVVLFGRGPARRGLVEGELVAIGFVRGDESCQAAPAGDIRGQAA